MTEKTAKELVDDGICPECNGSLDTGWECNQCGYDARPIASGLDPESSEYLLKEVKELRESVKPDEENAAYRHGFLDGRAFELTRGLANHPKDWDGMSCYCNECRSSS